MRKRGRYRYHCHFVGTETEVLSFLLKVMQLIGNDTGPEPGLPFGTAVLAAEALME